ncbi:MAG: ribosome small subunit-dependent GTPase A [Acidimicrobiales bacterium]
MAYGERIDTGPLETYGPLAPYGWSDHWAQLLRRVPDDPVPGRVVRHDGVALMVATSDGVVQLSFGRRVSPPPTVGDWVAVADGEPVAVLERRSLLRRKAADGSTAQSLAANVDVVLLACGVDRPLNLRRLERELALVHDAPATPVIVLTKVAAGVQSALKDALSALDGSALGADVVATSVKEGIGVEELRGRVGHSTATLMGESGAGKSSIVNALTGTDSAATASVRSRDSKGRHTTTTRQLHLLSGGGVLIDSPGIRAVGIWSDPEAVAETFADLDRLAGECRFADCAHDVEPGCALVAVAARGDLDPVRLEAWRVLRAEASEAAGAAGFVRRPRNAKTGGRRR